MRLKFLAPVAGAVIGLTAFFYSADSAPKNDTEVTLAQLELFAKILAHVEQDYVTDVDNAEIIEASIDGMLSSLDPHSSYLNPEEFRAMNEQTSGEYSGLGVEVTQQEGLVLVVSPMDDSPASRAGIQSGDYFSAVDGQNIVGMTLNDAIKLMKGAANTDVTLTVLREGVEPFDVTLTRAIIRPEVVTHRAEGDIGYVRISSFNQLTTDGVEDAIDALRKEIPGKMRGLVLDLRSNPGGLLDQAVSVSSLFLDGGEIVSARGRRPEEVNRYNARRGERLPNTPIVILINGGSASAAEIVAGALKDHGRALILGEISFGKGSVQSVIPLGGKQGAIRLTTQRYYTPSNASIQGAGIEPDIEVAAVRLTDDEMANIEKRAKRYTEASLRNALENDQGRERRAPHVPEEQPPADYEGDDYQLDRALEVLRTTTLASDLLQKG